MKYDRKMLAEHGTDLMVLKPASIIGAAKEDLRRKLRNEDAGRRRAVFSDTGYEQYAFHRNHVRRSIDVQDLLTRALMEPGIGLASGKYDTRLIYSNGELLFDAIKLVSGDEAN